MKKIMGGIIGLIVFAVTGFLIVGASQQLELRVNVPPGVDAYIDGKMFKPCKHEDRPKGQRCDPAEVRAHQFRWFVNGGKSYALMAVAHKGRAERTVRMQDTSLTVVVQMKDGLPVFVGGDD
jgi:hypothetical protein